MNGEPIGDATGPEDDRPSLLRRAVAAITGWVIDKKFTPEHWAEGTVHALGDNTGGLSMAGMLPDRRVLVIHSPEHQPCGCSPSDYAVKHVDYSSVTGTTYDRFDIGDTITEADKIIDIE